MDRRTRSSKRSSDQVIFGADPIFAVDPLETAHRKMTTGDVLEMLDERVVHGGTTEGADDWRACAATFCVTTNPKRVAT